MDNYFCQPTNLNIIGLFTAARFKFFMNRFSHFRIHQQKVLSMSQSPEASHNGWPDISAKVDLCVANCYSLARESIDFGFFPTLTGPWQICQNKL